MSNVPNDKEKAFEWLRSEQDFANERIAAYSEADLKIISVIATIVAAVIGLSKLRGLDTKSFPFILLLSSMILSLAVLQSVVYSSLALLFMVRKVLITKRLAEFLGVGSGFAFTDKSLLDPYTSISYAVGVIAYFGFKAFAGLGIVIAAYIVQPESERSFVFWSFFAAAGFMALLSSINTIVHLFALFNFIKDVKSGSVRAS